MHDDVTTKPRLRRNYLHFHHLSLNIFFLNLNTLGNDCCQISQRLNSKLRVDFHCRVIFTCVRA